ncbi:DUF3515 domain-containing protein [Micromonospora yasonensis]|uniref:DUF3515 domain-containing protein n=1 Tax=Micromonospora yasonensis TaxID=1128667 RepID=UPI00222F2AE9|nr:DUF3515 domain-containing protein [Micromonospora yasonensis]MCW3842438.1 DUF3515 domain-containing protein [Micromonospora yasonensis]
MDEITSSPAPDESRPAGPRRDRSARAAALWATLIAVPVTLAVAGFTFAKLAPDEPAAAPSASASAPRPQSTTPVELPAPALAERPAVLCRALVSQLPASLRDLEQRPVTAGAEQNAAYGDPALTVTCGADAPVKPCPSPTAGQMPDGCFPDTDEVWSVNKVCWHPTQEADATVLTAVDRETPIQVRVPKEYAQPLQWVSPISDAIVSAVPSAKTAPSGCSA